MEQLSANFLQTQQETKQLASAVRGFLGKYQTALQSAFADGIRAQRRNADDYFPLLLKRRGETYARMK